MTTKSETAPSMKERFWEEMRKYGLVSAYLYVCFGALLLYKASILDASSTEYLPYGLALAKALILGKFILIGGAVKVGSRADSHPLLHRIAWKSVAFLVMLLVFTAIEEIIVGWFHHKTVAQVATEVMERSFIENLAPSILMLLILIPLITVSELSRTLGKGGLKRLFL